MPAYQALLFDFDGTIIDSQDAIIGCMQHALQSENIQGISEDMLYNMIGMPLQTGFADVMGISGKQLDSVVAAYKKRWLEWGKDQGSLYDGIVPLLQKLQQQGIPMAIATAKSQAGIDRSSKQFGVADYFTSIHGTDIDMPDKHGVVQAALAALRQGDERICADQCIMIGDRFHDAEAATANGCQFIGVHYGYGTSDEFKSCTCLAELESVADLQTFLL